MNFLTAMRTAVYPGAELHWDSRIRSAGGTGISPAGVFRLGLSLVGFEFQAAVITSPSDALVQSPSRSPELFSPCFRPVIGENREEIFSYSIS